MRIRDNQHASTLRASNSIVILFQEVAVLNPDPIINNPWVKTATLSSLHNAPRRQVTHNHIPDQPKATKRQQVNHFPQHRINPAPHKPTTASNRIPIPAKTVTPLPAPDLQHLDPPNPLQTKIQYRDNGQLANQAPTEHMFSLYRTPGEGERVHVRQC